MSSKVLNQKRQRKPNPPYDPFNCSTLAASTITTGSTSTKKQKKANALKDGMEDAKIVVGVDFGTTFSGFAYASNSDPEKIYTFYEWPCQAEAGARPYCKTQTSLWYLPGEHGTFDLQDWGWSAQVNHSEALQQAKNSSKKSALNDSGRGKQTSTIPEVTSCGHFLTNFKLYLGPVDRGFKGEKLPPGLSVERAISDYLRELCKFIMVELKNKFGAFIEKKDIKWCLTVPTSWTDKAKQTMKDCAEMAGLVHGSLCPSGVDASSHKLEIVLEPEAAAIYCQQKLRDFHLRKGSKYLVVDAGGGTVDLVVHEKIDDFSLKTKELTLASGCCCGGTYVDEAFFTYLGKKIDNFQKFSAQYPATILTINGYWESLKCNFDGLRDHFDLELPAKLAKAWQKHDSQNGWTLDTQYDELVITREDMKSIFDGEVKRVLEYIKDQLINVPDMDAIMVVGGFAKSPYLMKRIREEFSTQVKQIISPPDPGSAVGQGAVAFGAQGADIMLSRKSSRTYGIDTIRAFRKGDPPGSVFDGHDGEKLCKDTFCPFVKIGDDVPVDFHRTYEFYPFQPGEAEIKFTMYSTSDINPSFVTDPGVVKVGSWRYKLPLKVRNWKKEHEKPLLEVTMYFGRTHLEVSAQAPEHLGGGKTCMFTVELEKDLV